MNDAINNKNKGEIEENLILLYLNVYIWLETMKDAKNGRNRSGSNLIEQNHYH